MIEIKNLTVRYDEQAALEGLTFTLEHPSFLVILGPNGAGKTTLLRSLLGLVPYQGEIKIFGKEPREARSVLGYMPQRDRINRSVPLRVRDVVMMPLLITIGLKKETIRRAKWALKIVEMEKYWNKDFRTLSGGQQQRVFLARTLARDPKVILLDEPFSATDVATKMAVIKILHRLKKERTIILVTHDVNPLVECTDKVLLLNRRMVDFGRLIDVITEDNMKRLYGTKVPIIRSKDLCYIIGGDVHVRP